MHNLLIKHFSQAETKIIAKSFKINEYDLSITLTDLKGKKHKFDAKSVYENGKKIF